MSHSDLSIYNLSISKMLIKLLEIGYLKFLENGGDNNETYN